MPHNRWTRALFHSWRTLSILGNNEPIVNEMNTKHTFSENHRFDIKKVSTNAHWLLLLKLHHVG